MNWLRFKLGVLFKCGQNMKTFQKMNPRRIFEDRGDAGGGVFFEYPLPVV